jgi:hypothetical protein
VLYSAGPVSSRKQTKSLLGLLDPENEDNRSLRGPENEDSRSLLVAENEDSTMIACYRK